MSRLQKKCLIASAGLHLLLGGILFIGPAFLSSEPPPDNSPILDIIPAKLVDGNFSGGGNPKAKPPPPAPVVPKSEPAPADPEPQPEPVKLRGPAPPQETVKDRVEEKSDPDSLEMKPRKRRLPQISLKQVVRRNDEADKRRAARAAAAAAERERYAQQRRLAALIGSTARNLNDDVAPSTGVEAEYGPGGGGEAYASYDEAVRSIYWHAWVPPEDTASNRAVGKASVVIARDGHVVSARLIVPCGDSSVDRSIERTLERVTFIAPFPEGAKDKERTYTIRFDLSAKRLNG